MNTLIDSPTAVIGSKITTVIRKATGVDLETDLQTFRFLIQLSNGMTLELFPGDIRQNHDPLEFGNSTDYEIDFEGRPDIVGEEIIAMATFVFGASRPRSDQEPFPRPGHRASRLYDVPRHVALIFASGRVAIDFYMCGGVSELQLSSLEGLTKHFNKPWHDYWTEENLELEKLHVKTK